MSAKFSFLYEINLMNIFFTTRFARANFGGRQRPEAKGRKRLACHKKAGNDERNGNFYQ
jgi:hypothetical protein